MELLTTISVSRLLAATSRVINETAQVAPEEVTVDAYNRMTKLVSYANLERFDMAHSIAQGWRARVDELDLEDSKVLKILSDDLVALVDKA